MPNLFFSGAPIDAEPGTLVALPDGGFLVLDNEWRQPTAGGASEYDTYRSRYDAFGEQVQGRTLLGQPDDRFYASSPQALADGSLVFVASERVERPNGAFLFTHRVTKQAADGSLVTLRTYRAETAGGPDGAFNPAVRTPDLDVAGDGSIVLSRTAGTDGAEELVVDVLEADGSVRSLGSVMNVEREEAAFDTEESIALADGRMLVVWNDLFLTPATGQDGSGQMIRAANFMGRFVGPDGQPEGDSFIIRSDTLREPSGPNPISAEVVALPDGGFALTTRIRYSGANERTDERSVAIFDASGARVTADQRYAADHTIPGDSVVASLGDGRLAAFWIVFGGGWEQETRPFTVYGQAFSADGRLSGAEFVVGDGRAGFASLRDPVVLADGRVAVSWYGDGRDDVQDDGGTVVQILDPRQEAIVFEGTAGDDRAIGTGLNDTLSGAGGRDTLDGADGVDLLTGGAGNDLYVLDDPRDRVVEGENGGIDAVRAGAGVTLAANVENLVLIGSRAIGGTGNALSNAIRGNDAANALSGAGGDDLLQGGGGDDALDGGTGRDTLAGGRGNDTYVLSDRDDAFVEIAGQGIDTIRSFFNHALSGSFENLTLLGTASLKGTGDANANRVTGNDGANVLNGLGGADTLEGGRGFDTLRGGDGGDTYVLRDRDVVAEGAGSGRDAVHAHLTYRLGATVEDLVLLGTAPIDGYGNDGDNVLVGNDAANVLGGGLGADTLVGGRGDDLYLVGAGDRVVERSSFLDDGGFDTVRSFVDFSLMSQGGIERVELLGRAERATGDSRDNELVGNAGDNRLEGWGGLDTLTGGDGRDLFVFTLGPSRYNLATVTDFLSADDTIGLGRWAFGDLGSYGSTLDPEKLAAGPRATEADDRIVYDDATGALLYDRDGSGAAGAVKFAQLAPDLALTAADFLVL